MGHPGFSYVGLAFLLALFVPNLLWTRRKPRGYAPEGENRALALCERAGQACVTCTALCFSDFNLRPWTPWNLWLAGACLLMALYEVWWVRYFRGPRTLADFYSSLLGVPVAGATLPVAAFFLLGVYGRVVWMLLAAVLLGVGHIGIHLQHRHQLEHTAG